MTIVYLSSAVAISAFALAMVYFAVSDVLTMTVSDRLLIALLAAFPILAPLSGWSLETIGFAVAAALVAFFTSIALFALGWIGGGDGKLLTVTVLWLGHERIVDFVVAMSVLGGLCTLAILLFRRCRLGERLGRESWIARLHRSESGVPYAVAICTAALLILPDTAWLENMF